MDNDGIEQSILVPDSTNEQEERKESALLAQRLQYYQQFNGGNDPADSSDDEAVGRSDEKSRGSLEQKNTDEDDNEQEDEENEFQLLNEYAPLEEVNDDDFGEFTEASSVDRHLEDLLNSNNPDDLEKNILFNRILRDNHRYQRETTAANPAEEEQEGNRSLPSETIQEVEDIKMTVKEEGKGSGRTVIRVKEEETEALPASSSSTEQYRSIPPLSQEKVQKIKDIMSSFKLKNPPNLGTMSFLETLERRHLRLGDESADSQDSKK
jgi:hypothetical protein